MNTNERKEQKDELMEKLKSGIQRTFTSEHFQKYLRMASLFHGYSFRNTLLILMQKPDASQVAGFGVWKKLNRHVLRGEKGIEIFAPVTVKEKVEKLQHNEDGTIKADGQGNPVTVIETKLLLRFKTTHVFDVAQTDGDPLPEICPLLQGSMDNYADVFQALKEVSPFPVAFEHLHDGSHGYCDFANQKIALDYDMPDAQTIKTLIHEIGHATLHHAGSGKPRRQAEVEAEATAFIVADHLGLDTSEYSFDYIASWAADMDFAKLSEVLANIQSNAHQLISDVDNVVEKIQKSREQEKSAQPLSLDQQLHTAQQKAQAVNAERFPKIQEVMQNEKSVLHG